MPIAVESALRAPPGETGSALAGLAEDQWFERKSARIAPRDLANSLIGMANADGGIVVVGLRAGHVEGTDHTPAKRNDLMQAGIDHCEPPVRTDQRLVDCKDTAIVCWSSKSSPTTSSMQTSATRCFSGWETRIAV